MVRQLANRDLAVVLFKPSASIHSMKSFDLINLLHVPSFIHGKEKGTHLPFRVSLEALEKPMRKTRQEVRPLRGRIPHVAWLRIKEVSRFPVSQRCAERNMVEVRTRADAQVHFGKEQSSPAKKSQSTPTVYHNLCTLARSASEPWSAISSLDATQSPSINVLRKGHEILRGKSFKEDFMSERSAVKSHVNPMTALACGVRGMGGARSCATDSPSRGGIVVETPGRYS